MDEELTSREVPHAGKKEQKCRFTNDDFSILSDDALIGAKAAVSVIGNDKVEPQESDEFTIGGYQAKLRGVGGRQKSELLLTKKGSPHFDLLIREPIPCSPHLTATRRAFCFTYY